MKKEKVIVNNQVHLIFDKAGFVDVCAAYGIGEVFWDALTDAVQGDLASIVSDRVEQLVESKELVITGVVPNNVVGQKFRPSASLVIFTYNAVEAWAKHEFVRMIKDFKESFIESSHETVIELVDQLFD